MSNYEHWQLITKGNVIGSNEPGEVFETEERQERWVESEAEKQLNDLEQC